jgi:hypothetical protein
MSWEVDQRQETYLEISELSKLLAAMIETAKVWFSLLVDDSVGTDISALSESLATDLTVVRSLASVAPLMSLRNSISLKKARNSTDGELTLKFPS